MTLETLAAQMQRLEAAWGYPKDRTAGQMVAMTREWFTQLDRFGAKSVELAVTHVIGANKFEWKGALPEVVAFCMKDDRDWREIIALQLPPPDPPAREPFERDGRTTEEEIEFRAMQVAEMKREAGLRSLAEVVADEIPKRELKPASQEMGVSEALLQTKLVRDLRRKLKLDADTAANQSSRSYTATDDFDHHGEGRN